MKYRFGSPFLAGVVRSLQKYHKCETTHFIEELHTGSVHPEEVGKDLAKKFNKMEEKK